MRTTTSQPMVTKNLYRAITQPVAGMTLLALVAAAYPFPTRAQTPTPQQPQGTTQTTPPVELQTTQSVEQNTDYLLGGGDRIRINVFDVPEYSGEYQVPPGGALYLPLIGGVSVRGLTQEQAAESIGSRYGRFLKRPLVTVSLISPRPINVIVAGEVNQPGSYTIGLQGGAGDNPGVQYPTVVGAITLANGVTLAANVRQIQLRRAGLGGTQQVTNLDLTQLIKTGNFAPDITLRDGDTIFVPTATNPNMAEAREFATTSFAAPATRPRTVTVVGAVNRPGSYVVVGGAVTTSVATGVETGGGGGGSAGGGLPTVTRAIQLAGGIKPTADIRNVRIRRFTKAGPEQTVNVNLWRLLNEGDVNQDTIVQDGDTVVIPTATDINPAEATALAEANFSPNAIRVSVVGEVRAPGAINLKPNTTLNQALQTAGGFSNSRARRSSVELIRLNPDGTVTKRNVSVDMAQGINEQNNPMLRDNDIVVVNRNGLARFSDTLGLVLSPITSVFSFVRIFGLGN